MNYSERYCAFVDVLGFAGLLKSVHKSDSQFETVKALLRTVHAPSRDTGISQRAPRYVEDEYRETDLRSQRISDAVAISALASDFGLKAIFDAVQNLAVELLAQGYFVRGAIVRNYLYHDDNMVFGDALVEAFGIEQNVAHYPRIVISREVMDDMRRYCGVKFTGPRAELEMSYVRQADDGPYFQNVLRQFEITAKGTNEGSYYYPAAAHPADVMKKLVVRLEESRYMPRHFEKVKWFCRYWNSVFPNTGYADQYLVTGVTERTK